MLFAKSYVQALDDPPKTLKNPNSFSQSIGTLFIPTTQAEVSNSSFHHPLSSPAEPQTDTTHLWEALAIVLVGHLASARSASGRASPALTTALSIEGSTATARATTVGGLGGASGGGRLLGGRATRATAVARASKQLRAGDLVRPAAVVGLAAGAIDADEDAGVGGRVGTGEADGIGGRGGATAGDVDLGAANVKLSTLGRAGVVKRDDLGAHEVVARGDAGGHVEVGPAAVGDQVVDGPPAVAETGLGDLEPLEPGGAGGGGVVDLGEVDDDGA